MPLPCAAAKGGISMEVYGLELPRKLLLLWQRTIWSPALSSCLQSSLDAGSGAVTFPVRGSKARRVLLQMATHAGLGDYR